MISFKRRQVAAGIGAALAAGMFGSVARAAMGPNDKFDLVIKGGEVLDPSQNLRGKRDIGMRFGKIEAVEADIPVARANRVSCRPILESFGTSSTSACTSDLALPSPCSTSKRRTSGQGASSAEGQVSM